MHFFRHKMFWSFEPYSEQIQTYALYRVESHSSNPVETLRTEHTECVHYVCSSVVGIYKRVHISRRRNCASVVGAAGACALIASRPTVAGARRIRNARYRRRRKRRYDTAALAILRLPRSGQGVGEVCFDAAGGATVWPVLQQTFSPRSRPARLDGVRITRISLPRSPRK